MLISVIGFHISWKMSAGLGTAIAVIDLVGYSFLHESPVWFVSNSRISDARKVYSWLWGSGHHVEVRHTQTVYSYWTGDTMQGVNRLCIIQIVPLKQNQLSPSTVASFQYNLRHIKPGAEFDLLQISNILITDKHDIQKCLKFLFNNCRYCTHDEFFTLVNCVCVCVCAYVWIILLNSFFKLKRYSHGVRFDEAADCKTAASFLFDKPVTKGVCTVFPCNQQFPLSLITLSKVKYGTIICVLNLSQLILSGKMMCPNTTFALTAHHTPSLTPSNGSTGIVCRSVSVLLAFTRIFKFVHL